MTKFNVPPDHRPIVTHAITHGWTLTRTRGGHLRLTSPNGALVIFGASPSCPRSAQNLRADLRRAGLETA